MKKVRVENLETLREIQSDTRYVIDKGDYEIGVSQTHERFLYLSNNDGSVKRIAFLLENLKNVVMDFSGSTLTFQGRITPFIIRDCVNVTLKNFTVAYDRPFFTCGKTLEHGGDYAKIRIDSKKFPYRIENGAMIAYGKYWEKSLAEGINLFIEIDNEHKRPAYNTGIILPLIGNEVTRHPTPPIYQTVWRAEETGEEGVVALYGDFSFLTGNNRFCGYCP